MGAVANLVENGGLLWPDLVLEVGSVEALRADGWVPELEPADGVVSHHLRFKPAFF